MKTSLVLSLFLLGIGAHGPVAMAQSPGAFTATGNMAASRVGHTATLLLDGRVLIVGGFDDTSILSSAEIYNPATGTFAPAGNMTTARANHSATLLPSGKVLIAGGLTFDTSANLTSPVTSAELYDPATGTFTPTGNMASVQTGATLLTNGKVLMTGPSYYSILRAELYDPATGTFALAGAFSSTSLENVGLATLLADGRVLVTNDWRYAGSGAAEVYDPGADTFVTTGSLNLWDHDYAATLLMNGTVLFVGNQENDLLSPADVEVYDPAAGSFTIAGHSQNPHFGSSATLLPDGTVLIAGSYSQLDCGGYVRPELDVRAELYDSAAGTFSVTGDMTTPRYSHTATLLIDGTVLVAGGYSQQGSACSSSPTQPTSSTEIYHPAVLVSAPALFSLSGNGAGQGAIWHSQTGQIASADNPAFSGEALSMYTTSLAAGGVIPPQVAVGGQLAGVLYFGAAPGYPGYYQVNFRVPSGVAPGPAVPVRLTYLSRPSNAVTIGVQ
jgi:hypothetical protein